MWQHKQEERELKRAEGDIVKSQHELKRTMRDYELGKCWYHRYQRIVLNFLEMRFVHYQMTSGKVGLPTNEYEDHCIQPLDHRRAVLAAILFHHMFYKEAPGLSADARGCARF